MTVVARRIVATPVRSALDAWAVIVDLVAPDKNSEARKELESVAGITSNLIADEAFENAAGVIYGSGPRLRFYCLYGDAAISGDRAQEAPLAFIPTEGDWRMSFPCPTEDLEWVRDALKEKSTRITARDLNDEVEEEGETERHKAAAGFEIDREVFFNS